MRVLVALCLAVATTQAAVLKFESQNKEGLKGLFHKMMQGVVENEDELHGSFLSSTLGKLGVHYTPDAEDLEKIAGAIENGVATIGDSDSESNAVNEVSKPWFCHDLECPEFKVIEKTKDYELREYPATSWVTTTLTGVDYDMASYEMFMKLFQYISGANEKKEKIKMTTPVITRVIPGQGPTCENNFTMSFFNIPNVTPPTPTGKDVMITSLPKLRAYVRSFGGFAKQKDYIEEAAKMNAALPTSAKYHNEFYYFGGYDAPFTLINRHNEVWFIAE